MLEKKHIAVIGLGYVGLPLAIEFSKITKVIGFDIDENRIARLKDGIDATKEISQVELCSTEIEFTSKLEALKNADIYIITVPTPINDDRTPNLNPLRLACRMVANVISDGNIVIFESTVYPGVTEEVCVPIISEKSGLKYNRNFFVGYSPERINPGDKSRRLNQIVKVTSGSTPVIADEIDNLYSAIISAGTWRAPSIRVAEAAKVIENTQRDINIALVNEFSLIFDEAGIDTHSVLDAASTKWNFLNFRPGLVGGHCIGVDPYYLTHLAAKLGYNPEIILAGRRLNDEMPKLVAKKFIKKILKSGTDKTRRVLILGATFKENCPDIRNSKIVDLANEISDFGFLVDMHDPLADAEEFERCYGLKLIKKEDFKAYDGVILAVPHEYYINRAEFFIDNIKPQSKILYDLKGVLAPSKEILR